MKAPKIEIRDYSLGVHPYEEAKEINPRATVTFSFPDGGTIDVAIRNRGDGFFLDVTGSTMIQINPVAANLVRVRPVRD